LVADFPKTAFILPHAGLLEDLSDTGRTAWRRLLIGDGPPLSEAAGVIDGADENEQERPDDRTRDDLRQVQPLNLGWVTLPVL
jgi:hypothetical protein